MQNNPFNNFLAQLQGAASNMPTSTGQDGAGQSAGNMMGNANLFGAMQNAMARGPTTMPGNVLTGAMPSVSASPDMSVFRQFQLQQSQPLPAVSGSNAQRTTGVSSGAAMMTNSPTAAGNVQALSGGWNNPGNPSAALQVPPASWNNPAPAGGTGNATAGMNNNPLMNAMMQTYLSQQMAMQQQQQQQAQTNPMAGLMQQMVQSMMPFNAGMPAAGTAAAPATSGLDPNIAKQLVMQLVGQLQQSGQLSNADSIQQLLQPGAGAPQSGAGAPLSGAGAPQSGAGEAASNVAAASKEVVADVQICDVDDEDEDEIKEEREEPPVVAKKIPGPRSSKGKGPQGARSTVVDVPVRPKSPPKKPPPKKTPQTKKSAQKAPVETGGGDDRFDVAAGIKTETWNVRRKGPAGKTGNKKISEVVAVDSDSDDASSSFHAEETASEGSSVVEERKPAKKGKSKVKAAKEKATKKPGKDQHSEPAVGSQKGKKGGDPRINPEPVRRIKIEDIAGDPSWITEQVSRSPRVAKGAHSEPSTSEEFPIHVKSEEGAADVKPYIIPPGVKLRRCEVKLQKLVLKRDARGNFIVPRGPSDAVMFKKEPYAAGRSKVDVGSGGKRGSPGAARDVSMTQSHGIVLLPNLNAATQPQMRTLYVGHMKGNMQWLNLIGWAKSRCFCQCAFCPILSETPKAILSHIRTEHPDLTFALTKMKQPTGKFLYIFCRHCDFISLDVTINWLHFEVYHNVSDILEGTARPRLDDFAPAKLEIQRGLEDIMETQQSYMCYDCELITDESKQLAIHVLQQHADTVHYNGCFVKLLGIRQPLKSENVAYKRIVADEEFAEFRQEAFICMMCDYIAHCPYMALSHNLNTHQTKRILFSCMERSCEFNCVSESQMIQHLSGRHKLKADLTCSTTLLEPSSGSFVECAIGVNRKTSGQPSLVKCNAPGAIAANPGRVSPVTFTSDEDTETEDGDDKEKKPKTKKIKTEGGEKKSLQCTAVSSSLEKGLENGNGTSADGTSVADDDGDSEEGKLPDDIQITINPPSPDGVDEDAKSPGSEGSNNTIVEDAPDNDEVSPPKQDEEEMTVDLSSADEDASKADEQMESEEAPELEPVAAKKEDLSMKDAGAGDFAADIPPEPYCLSADGCLQVPSADIGELGTDVSAEGASCDVDEQSRQLNTPEKLFP